MGDVEDSQKAISERGFAFPLPFPFGDVEIIDDYLAYLEGSIPSLWHLPLTEVERTELDAWEESCLEILEERRRSEVKTGTRRPNEGHTARGRSSDGLRGEATAPGQQKA